MTHPIAILGAGPGGLMLARLLEMHNIDYVVYERNTDAESASTEGTLDIHVEDGQLALKDAGLLDKFKDLAVYEAQAAKFVDEHLNIIWNKPYEGQTDRPEIDRPLLRRLLLDSIPAEKIKWNHAVKSVQRGSNGLMAVSLVGGAEQTGFRLVVGADGGWSKARKLVTASVPEYSGHTYLQSSIMPSNPAYAEIASFAGAGMYFAFGKSKGIVCQRMSTGVYHIYIGLPLDEDWIKLNPELLHSGHFRQQLLDDHFAGWHPQTRSLISAMETSFRPWPLYRLPKEALPWTHVNGVTLIGDAAHLSVPNGEGVNLALFDSHELAKGIVEAGTGDLEEAIRKYEQAMFERGVASIKEGDNFLDMFFAHDAPRTFKAWVAEMANKPE